jgi:peptidoglycan/xylan/chitin deacetylase (PgdA/CDA1 family)
MKRITLTFDNGPDPEGTPRVLDVLAAHGIAATFFVLGSRALQPGARELLARTHAAGHRIGNHSFSHQVPLGDDPGHAAVEREIEQTETVLLPFTHGSRLFRPFGGGGKIGPHLLSAEALDYLVEHRYTCVLWNCVPGDWLDERGWVENALKQCDACEWPVVVLHDSYPHAMEQLDTFIVALRARGYAFSQALPPDVLPLEGGMVRHDLAAISAAPLRNRDRVLTDRGVS